MLPRAAPKPNTLWLTFKRWHLLLWQLLSVTLFSFGMIFWLNGRSFAIGGRHLSVFRASELTQSDITTIISSCLVVTRLIAGSWHALIAWRCVFILLEKTGLTLTELSRLASFHVPAITTLPVRRRRQASLYVWTAAIILLLGWPAQLSNPIANGSITWTPDYAFNKTGDIALVGTATAGVGWQNYRFDSDRTVLVQNAGGLASLGSVVTAFTPSGNNKDVFAPLPARRMAPLFAGYANGTVVSNITVPVFEIKAFEWVKNISDLPSGIHGSIVLSGCSGRPCGYLNITGPDVRPLGQTVPGTSALLKDTAWVQPDITRLPSATLFEGYKYAAIYVARYTNIGIKAINTCKTQKTVFDPLPPGIDMVWIGWNLGNSDTHFSDCIAVARLQIRAGVTQCRGSASMLPLTPGPSSSSSPSCVLSAKSSSIIESTSNPLINITADPLIEQVFALMPEVQMTLTAISATNLYPTDALSGNLERHLRDSLITSYQGTWSALNDAISAGVPRLQTQVWGPHEVLTANVAVWRIYLFWGLNLLLTLAGLLLMGFQRTSDGVMVVDSVLDAISLDSSKVTDAQGGARWEDCDMRVKLKNGTGWGYASLVPDNGESVALVDNGHDLDGLGGDGLSLRSMARSDTALLAHR